MNGKLQSLYCYPDTDVLINKFGVRTLRELNVLENEFSLNMLINSYYFLNKQKKSEAHN